MLCGLLLVAGSILFQMQVFVHRHHEQRNGEQSPSLSVDLLSQDSLCSPSKCKSPAGHFLSDSFQASQLLLSLTVILCVQPARCFSNSNPRAYIPVLAEERKGVFPLVCLSFLFCLCFCCCCPIYTFQSCHAGLSQPPNSCQTPLWADSQSKQETNNLGREISKCIQRNVLLQRQEWGPPGAHYCSQWDKAGRELLSWLPGEGENKNGGGKLTRSAV